MPADDTRNPIPTATRDLEHLRYLHEVAEHYKDTIYARAGIILALIGGQVAALAVLPNMVGEGRSVLETSSARVAVVAAFAVHMVAAVHALIAIMPLPDLLAVRTILRKKSKEFRRVKPELYSSFNHVVEQTRDDFVASISAADNETLFKDLSNAYYNLCHITNARYLRLRKAFLWQLISLGVLLIIVLLAVLIGPNTPTPTVPSR